MRNALTILAVVWACGAAACGGSSNGGSDGQLADGTPGGSDAATHDGPPAGSDAAIDAPIDAPPGTPTLAIGGASVAEGNTGTANATFTVTLAPASTATVTVDFATADGTAIAGGDPSTGGADYLAASGTLTFAPGDTSKTITVAVTGDLLSEDDETFTVALANGSNAALGTATATGTITNDDAIPTLAVGSASTLEGTAVGSTALVPVTLSAPAGRTVTVTAATADGTALAGSDYLATSTGLTFAPGETSKTVGVLIIADALNEADETFTVNLASPVHATLGTAAGTVTITNDDPLPSVSVSDLRVLEGNAGTSTANVPVVLSAASGRTVTVAFATADDTATSPSDYAATSGTITFAPGETSKTIPVTVDGDTTVEADEDLLVTLASPTNATVGDGQATLTLVDDDATGPRITIDDATITEGNAGTKNLVFTVHLSTTAATSVSVSFGTVDGTATATGTAATGGQDYTATSGTVVIPAGQLTGTIAVPIRGDVLNEADETFGVVLANAVNGAILDGQATGTIANDDATPTLAINGVTTTEGNTGSVNATYTVTLSAASGQIVTVAYATADGTAQAGSDYTAESGTLTFSPGTTTQPIAVPILGDLLDEDNETYTVNLSAPTHATIATGIGSGLITDNDATPSITVADTSVIEGDAGTTTPMVFTLSLSAASGRPVTVNYATADGTATVAGSDYVATSGTATFAQGTTTTTVAVTVNGDATNEANETVDLRLSAASNATIGDALGIGTITNDDGPLPNVTINDVTVTEGNTGTSTATFTVKLSRTSTLPISVDFTTADGTATAGADYQTTTGTLTIAAGATTGTIKVPIIGDTLYEADETYVVNLSNAMNATITDPQGQGTITDNDTPPALAITDVTTLEGNSGTTTAEFTVSLSKISGVTATVNFATADGTALAGSDYTQTTGTLTFPPGTTTQVIDVPILGDTLNEATETYAVKLTAPVDCTNPDGTGAGTIQDDDPLPTLAIDDVTVAEGNAGTTPMTFTVTLSVASGQTVTVAFATANNTAVAPTDYTAKTGTLTFPPGTLSQQITVSVKGDVVVEPDEGLFVNLTNPTNAAISDGQGIGTIANDD